MNISGPPQLNVPAGAQFGHRSRLPFGKNHRVLVNAATEMTVGPGLHLLVAPNGSGKTTLLRTLAGLHPALHGSPTIRGRVHYVSDELKMDPELKPASLFGAWFANGALTHARQLAEKFKLDLRCAIGKHSRGNRQKVLLIIAETLAAHASSTVLLMDEPFTGLDAGTRDTVAAHWASTPTILRLVVLHELESVGQADSLFTIAKGTLHHTRERKGPTWAETCCTLCCS
jgi:ABC-2 type transport system ATP-binding protein/manganese/iron transport system ATP-binding protein